MVVDIYPLFGLSCSASAEEIRRAYSRMSHEYPREYYPRMFERIRSLFEMLSEEQKQRKHHFVDEKSLSQLIVEGFTQMKNGNLEKARDAFGSYLCASPNDSRIRSMFGLFLLSTGYYYEAVLVFTDLVRVAPDDAMFHQYLGGALLAAAGNTMKHQRGEDSLEVPSMCEKARNAFKTALSLEPDQSCYYVLIARTYVAERRYAEALHWCKKVIKASGTGPSDEVEALLLMCEINLFCGNTTQIRPLVKRILRKVKHNPELKDDAVKKLNELGLL